MKRSRNDHQVDANNQTSNTTSSMCDNHVRHGRPPLYDMSNFALHGSNSNTPSCGLNDIPNVLSNSTLTHKENYVASDSIKALGKRGRPPKYVISNSSHGKRNITQDGTDIHAIYETPVNSESVRSNVANHSFHTSSSTSNVLRENTSMSSRKHNLRNKSTLLSDIPILDFDVAEDDDVEIDLRNSFVGDAEVNIEKDPTKENGVILYVVSMARTIIGLGSLLPVNDAKPKFSELYVYDTDNEDQNRIDAISTNGNQDVRLNLAKVFSCLHPSLVVQDDKLLNPERIDDFISAEIPDKDLDPDLYTLVTENNDAWVLLWSRQSELSIRREDGKFVEKNRVRLDNGNLCTIAIYINKGPDRVTAKIQVGDRDNEASSSDEVVDEIKDYYDCRYLSACESSWRILKYKVVYRTPAVERLPFHLPGQQQVVYDEDDDIDDVLNKPSVASTKFLAWMDINKTNDLAKTLTYAEFPTKFVWIAQKRIWQERKRGYAVGRIHNVPRSVGDAYYLRVLLNKVKGPTSWDKLYEYDDIMHPSFRDACFARGLLDDDREYILGLEEIHGWEVILAVENNKGGVFFLYGYGGTGKTYIWRTLSAAIRCKGDIVLNVASSGIASLLLPGGRTAHSRFGIPINVDETSVCSITHGSDLAALLGKTKLIIWDEAPMMNKHCFEALDRTLRDILRVSNIPFGGKVIVFGGDFRQILPVITGGTRQDIVNASLNSSYLWDHINVLRLTKNMRLKNGSGSSNTDDIKEFADWILKVGDGRLGGPNDGEAMIDIPDDILIKDCADPVGALSLYSPDVLNDMKLAGLPNHTEIENEKRFAANSDKKSKQIHHINLKVQYPVTHSWVVENPSNLNAGLV
ncbi:ATP-dependent DNA helicase PIF1-like protein [Tanacetum coccineum]